MSLANIRLRPVACKVLLRIVITIRSGCHHNPLRLSSQFAPIVITIRSDCHHNPFRLSSQSAPVVITIRSDCHHNPPRLSSQFVPIVITIRSGCHHNPPRYCGADTRFFHLSISCGVCTSPRHTVGVRLAPPVCAPLRPGLGMKCASPRHHGMGGHHHEM